MSHDTMTPTIADIKPIINYIKPNIKHIYASCTDTKTSMIIFVCEVNSYNDVNDWIYMGFVDYNDKTSTYHLPNSLNAQVSRNAKNKVNLLLIIVDKFDNDIVGVMGAQGFYFCDKTKKYIASIYRDNIFNAVYELRKVLNSVRQTIVNETLTNLIPANLLAEYEKMTWLMTK
jgi:predicted RNA-binding protein